MSITSQRFWVGVFSLAFLLFSGFNGYRLIELEGRPLASDPGTIKALRAQLDRLNTSQEAVPPVEWREPYESEVIDAGAAPDVGPSTALDASSCPDSDDFVLPVLSGIISVQDPEGRMVFRALLDGQMKHNGQRVGDFHITQVTERGVQLRHPRGRTFLPNPDPTFTIDRGNTRTTP